MGSLVNHFWPLEPRFVCNYIENGKSQHYMSIIELNTIDGSFPKMYSKGR